MQNPHLTSSPTTRIHLLKLTTDQGNAGSSCWVPANLAMESHQTQLQGTTKPIHGVPPNPATVSQQTSQQLSPRYVPTGMGGEAALEVVLLGVSLLSLGHAGCLCTLSMRQHKQTQQQQVAVDRQQPKQQDDALCRQGRQQGLLSPGKLSHWRLRVPVTRSQCKATFGTLPP